MIQIDIISKIKLYDKNDEESLNLISPLVCKVGCNMLEVKGPTHERHFEIFYQILDVGVDLFDCDFVSV